ncbi:MAG: DNA cytosine methyltransferase [Trichloromonas sp.]|nr:DNA cytosine methyltransferase [Trichloromonas sp.]
MGWEPQYFSEVDPFPSAVLAVSPATALAEHYCRCGDMTRFKVWNDATLDVLIGGPLCQIFSVTELREGLDNPRGNLMRTYLAIADRYRPRWLV